MKFNADNTVEFNSSYNDGNDDRTISYRVASSQVPELTFESHSVFHAIYEEDRIRREFEFVFESVSAERIDFVSKTDLGDQKTRLSFYKGSTGDLAKAIDMKKKMIELSYFKEIEVEGSTYRARLITFPGKAFVKEEMDDGEIKMTEHDLEVTNKGLWFSPGVMIDGIEFNNFAYNDANGDRFIGDKNSKKAVIKVVGDVFETEKGMINTFFQKDYKAVVNYSYKLDSIAINLRRDISDFQMVQLYVRSQAVMCYAPGKEGGSWSGFTAFSFAKTPNSNNLSIKWGRQVWGPWWIEVRKSKGGKLLLEFLQHDEGMYLEKIGPEVFAMVSRFDPSMYMLLSNI
jgi:hypothetical protein